MLEALESDLAGKTITADALLTQTKLADFQEQLQLRHGRIERRAIWTTTALNDYLDFPHIRQAFFVERPVTAKANGRQTVEYAYGITSHPPDSASAERLLALNRGHWTAEAVHHILDTAWNRCRIRTGHGPENTTRLRRFAIGVIRARAQCIAATVRKLNRKPRLVFDYLKMTENTLNPKRLAPSRERTN